MREIKFRGRTLVKQESATIVDDLLGQTNQEDGE